MSHLFSIGSNPFGTPVGQMIEKATDGSQASENWAMYMEVCDLINETEDGPKDGVKAMKKRLSHNAGKNYQVVIYTLTLLETCVKNCGRRFHIQIVHKDFLQDLVKIIGPKNDPPQIVQEKILALIQTWADAFQGIPELKEVGKIYLELKSKGIEFPATDLDHMAPIHTPARTAPGMDAPPPQPHRTGTVRAHVSPAVGSPPRQAHTMPHGGVHSMPPVQTFQAPVGPVMLAPEQLSKLKSELDIVQQNMKVFSEMLTELTPTQGHRGDLELLKDLNSTCKEMQLRIMELIERVQNEEVTGELLRMNDELNNLFLRYERFERMGTNQKTPPAALPAANPAAHPAGPATAVSPVAALMSHQPHQPPAYNDVEPPAAPPGVGNLIDLGDSGATQPITNPSDISMQLAGLDMGAGTVSGTLNQLDSNTGPVNDDEFDMFAQSRQSFEQNKQAPASGAYMNQVYDQYPGGLGAAVSAKATNSQGLEKETDYNEMEKWLKENPGQVAPESATSSEFDKFLAERAHATDSLPEGDASQRQNQRQMKADEPENTMFAL